MPSVDDVEIMNAETGGPSNVIMRNSKFRVAVSVVSSLGLLALAASALALEPGARAPEIGGRDLQGNEVTIGSLRGRVVVVDFWASWCEPCAASLPVYERLYNQYRARGLTIVGISQDRQVEDARQFVSRHRISFPVVFDQGHAIARRYSPPRMPTAYVIDRQGVVRHIHAGYRSGDAERLESEIRALLDQR
jgi:peroxiredoxin